MVIYYYWVYGDNLLNYVFYLENLCAIIHIKLFL